MVYQMRFGIRTEISVERIRHVSQDTTQAAMNESCDDLALVHATKTGDVNAFEKLVKRYDRRLLRIAQNLTHNREDAEDAVQEAFLKAFQHLEQFRESAKFSTWLIRIALNESLLKLRKQRVASAIFFDKNFQTEEEDNFPIDVADWAPNPEQLYQASELREILRKTLRELSPALSVVFVLQDMEGFSLEQTAELLDLSLTAVKARSRRARLQLRERLTAYFKREAATDSSRSTRYSEMV
jgi:RNA polymerase sigma-70 factor (ECF subfamily)